MVCDCGIYWTYSLNCFSNNIVEAVAGPEEVQGGSLEPLTRFLISYENEIIWSLLFHSHVIFKK